MSREVRSFAVVRFLVLWFAAHSEQLLLERDEVLAHVALRLRGRRAQLQAHRAAAHERVQRRDRARAHEVEETLQGKINELVAMLAELTLLHENLVPAEPAEVDASEQKRE